MNPPKPMKAIHPKTLKSSTPTKDDANDTMMSVDLSQISNASTVRGGSAQRGRNPWKVTRPGSGSKPSMSTRPGSGTKPCSGTKPGTGTKPGSSTKPKMLFDQNSKMSRNLFTSVQNSDEANENMEEYASAHNEYLLQVANRYLAHKELDKVKKDTQEQLTAMATRLAADKALYNEMEKRLCEISFASEKTQLVDETFEKLNKLNVDLDSAAQSMKEIAAATDYQQSFLEVRNLALGDITPGIRQFTDVLKDTVKKLDSLRPGVEGQENVAAAAAAIANINEKLEPTQESQDSIANCLSMLADAVTVESALALKTELKPSSTRRV